MTALPRSRSVRIPALLALPLLLAPFGCTDSGGGKKQLPPVDVYHPPYIASQPQPGQVQAGDPATFKVLAASFGPPAYQWYVIQSGHTTPVQPGGTSDTLQIGASTLAMDGADYFAEITDTINGGRTRSGAARLSVTPLAAILSLQFAAPGQVTATLQPGGTPVPGGTVDLKVDGVDHGALAAGGPLTWALAAGPHRLLAAYSGDAHYAPVTTALAETPLGSDTLSITASPARSQYGQPVTLAATLTSGLAPSLSIDHVIQTGTTGSGGTVTLQRADLARGGHTLGATALGASVQVGQTVDAAATVVTVTAGLPFSVPGAPPSFTATVQPSLAGGTLPPTGTVHFQDGGTDLGSAPLSAGPGPTASATLASTSFGPAQLQDFDTFGFHAITARYSGDGQFLASTSQPDLQAVLGFAVTGTVTSDSAQPGIMYLSLVPTGGSAPVRGTALIWSGRGAGQPFTINGVPPGSYALRAHLAIQASGGLNRNDLFSLTPTPVTVGDADVSGPTVAVTTPQVPALAHPGGFRVSPMDGGAVIQYRPLADPGGVPLATDYDLSWSWNDGTAHQADRSFPANPSGIEVVTGLEDGIAYSFSLQANQTAPGAPGTILSSAAYAAPPPVTPHAGTGPVEVAGSAVLPDGLEPVPGSSLYVGLLDPDSGAASFEALTPQPYSASNGYELSGLGFGRRGDELLIAWLDQAGAGYPQPGDPVALVRPFPRRGASAPPISYDLQWPAITTHGTVTLNASTPPGGGPDTYTLVFDLRNNVKNVIAVSSVNSVFGPSLMDLSRPEGGHEAFFLQDTGSHLPPGRMDLLFQVFYSDTTSGFLTLTLPDLSPASPRDLEALDRSGDPRRPTFVWAGPAEPATPAYTTTFELTDGNGFTWTAQRGPFDPPFRGLAFPEDCAGPFDAVHPPLRPGTPYLWTVTFGYADGSQAQGQGVYEFQGEQPEP